MSRRHVDVPTPALALKGAEAAASLGISIDVFNRDVAPHLPCVRFGRTSVYSVRALEQWLNANARSMDKDLGRAAA